MKAVDIDRLEPEELHRRLEAGEPITLLDVREDIERATCAIKPATRAEDLHIPIGQVPDQLEAIRAAADGRLLVVYCHHGIRSLATAHWLLKQGFGRVANLEGGIDAWSVSVDQSVPRYE